MDFSYACRVASRLGQLTHRAVVSLASPQVQFSRAKLFLSFGLVLCTGGAEAQISLVNLTPCGPASFPGPACAIPASGAGHLLVVGLQVGSGANLATTITSITDNAGNIYTEAGAARSVDSSAGSFVDVWYAKNTVAGGTAITISTSAGITNAGVVIWEFAGADPNTPLDQATALNSQPASSTPTGAAVTTASAGEVIVSLAAVSGNVTGIATGNPFVSDASLKGNGWAHLFASSPATYSAQWAQSPAGTYASSTVSFIAAGSNSGDNPCDLNGDGVVNLVDAQLAVTMSLGQAPCTASIDGADVCNVVIVQRVVNAATGGVCVTGNSHIVSLSWTASTSTDVAGYNIFRGVVSGGPYTQLNTSLVPTLTYSDNNVQAGQSYYYVTTAVDTSNNQSVYSNEAVAAVPSP